MCLQSPKPQPLATAAARQAFSASVLPLFSGLRAAAMGYCRSPADADDLVQETVERAWRFWGQYRAGSNCRAWLHRILRNTYINRYRQRRREREVMGDYRAALDMLCEDAERGRPLAPMGDEVLEGFQSLSKDFQDVIWEVDVEGRSYREVAERLECPVGTVMSRLHRARGRLRDRLGPYAESQGLAPRAAA